MPNVPKTLPNSMKFGPGILNSLFSYCIKFQMSCLKNQEIRVFQNFNFFWVHFEFFQNKCLGLRFFGLDYI